MHQFFQILSVGKLCDIRTQYSLCGLSFLVSKMVESSIGRKISSNEGYLGVLPKKKPKPKLEENKFMFRVFPHNGLNLTLQLEDALEKMSVAKFVRTVRRKDEKKKYKTGQEKSPYTKI